MLDACLRSTVQRIEVLFVVINPLSRMTKLLTKVPQGAHHVDLIVHFSRENEDNLIQGPTVRLMLARKRKVLKKAAGAGDENSGE